MIWYYLFAFLITQSLALYCTQEHTQQIPIEFFVLIPSYNNEKFYYRNLDSVINQKCSYPFEVLYINDCSTDATGKLVETYVKKHKQEHRVTVQHNKKRVGLMANTYNGVYQCPDHKIVVILDGDDFFAHDAVLEFLAAVYSSPTIWMTSGRFINYPSGTLGGDFSWYPKDLTTMDIRKNAAVPALRSFYAKLFKLIKKQDLMHEGDFFSMASDVAWTLPVVEMAAKGHVAFVSNILYAYNIVNPISDFNVNLQYQQTLDSYIRTKEPYQPLESLF